MNCKIDGYAKYEIGLVFVAKAHVVLLEDEDEVEVEVMVGLTWTV